PVDRAAYVRLDPAKLNIAPRAAKATWFRLVGVPIGNGTTEYPHGDTVQVIEPWSPPDVWAGTTPQSLKAILDDIARGLTDDDGKPTGQGYSNGNKASDDRAVWRVVQRHHPDKPEGQCREIVNTWLSTGLLYLEDYEDPVQRKPRKGLSVNNRKRPS